MRKSPRRRAVAKRPGAFHHGDLRWALLEAARECLEREGPLGVCVRAAARAAGVSQTAPYRHFPDKESILAALAEEGFRDLGDRMAAAAAGADADAGEVLPAIAETYLAFAAERPQLFRLMFGPALSNRDRHPSLREAGLRAYQVLLDAIGAGQRAGVVRRGDAAELALAHWSAVHGAASLAVDGLLRERVATLGGVRPLARLVARQLRLGTDPE